MSSGGHRGFTTVTIITLIFAPFFTHHQWMWKLIGKTTETHVETCAPKQPCPPHRTIVNVVKQDPPAGPPQGGKDDKDAKDAKDDKQPKR